MWILIPGGRITPDESTHRFIIVKDLRHNGIGSADGPSCRTHVYDLKEIRFMYGRKRGQIPTIVLVIVVNNIKDGFKIK